MEKNEIAWVFDTLLCTPGMNEIAIKLDRKVSKSQILLLSLVVEIGLREGKVVVDYFANGAAGELTAIIDDCLERGQLTELSGRLKALLKK